MFPEGGEPLLSAEYVVDGVTQYAQAQLGAVDHGVLLPGQDSPTPAWALVVEHFNAVLARRFVSPLLEPDAGDAPAPPGPPREERVFVEGQQIRESLSLTHPRAGDLQALVFEHCALPGIDPPNERVIFAGLTPAGEHYAEPTLNVYFSGTVRPATLAHFGLPDAVGFNQTYYGVKVLLGSGKAALRLLDLNVEKYLPLPVPTWVELPDLRYGIARHFGAASTDTVDVYFETDRHAEVATWCEGLGLTPPMDGPTGLLTYGVTFDRRTKAIDKVKVYLWDETFREKARVANLDVVRRMLERWTRPTLDLT